MSIRRDPADIAFSQAVRMSRGFICEHCNKGDGRTELAHIYGRRFKSVRWDTLNGLCLCHTCHRQFTENPLDFTSWLREYVGQGYLDILNEKRNRIFKTTKAIRADIAKHYRNEIKLMESGPHDLLSFQ
jgi:hypothetical protein